MMGHYSPTDTNDGALFFPLTPTMGRVLVASQGNPNGSPWHHSTLVETHCCHCRDESMCLIPFAATMAL
ncbi:unnamed protein product, partial [Staurois parvus]